MRAYVCKYVYIYIYICIHVPLMKPELQQNTPRAAGALALGLRDCGSDSAETGVELNGQSITCSVFSGLGVRLGVKDN